MKSRTSVRHLTSSCAMRGAIRAADGLRRAWPAAVLCLAMLSAGAIWMTTSAKANHWAWKSWERMFGPASIHEPAAHVLAQLGGTGVYTITTIDEPSAGASAAEGTVIFGVNASGVVTGAYADQAGVAHGFVDANGTFTSFDALDETGLSPKFGWFQGTTGISIDTAGDVAGAYIDSNNAYHGFVRSAAGTITTFDDPNAPTATSSRGTFPLSINNAGQVVGTYSTGSYDTTSLYHGFIYNIATRTFTDLEEPNAGSGGAAYGREGTTPLSINDSGTVTGRYADASGNRHGFIAIPPYSSPADYASFDVSGAATNTGKGGDFSGTVPMSIDAAGDVVGSYTDSSFVRHGFIRSASGAITTFDAPGASATGASGTIGGTLPTSIDPTGSTIAGVYADSTGLGHGFVYYLPLTGKGSFTTFTPPNMTTSTAFPIQGVVLGANASGTVVGFYLDNSEAAHGFEYTSTPTSTPTFIPPPGTYSSAQSVTISDTDSVAAIYYTVDGSMPTVNSTKYSGPISVSSTQTINAIALDTTVGGFIESAVATATYTISGTTGVTATPTFSPPAGTYTSPQTVTISDITPGATIYYTTDGTAPSTSSAMYSGPITVSSSQTIEAIATASGYTDSAVAIAAYTINATPAAATPTFTPPGGTYNSTQTVTISDATPGARIYYTTNGTTPTTGSTQYSSPLTVSSSQTIEAIATASGYSASSVGSSAYTIISSAQGEWTWIGGSSTVNQPGVYGTLGVSAAANLPGARQIAASWTDSSGNVWIFGGWGYDASGTLGQLNDVWKLNLTTNQWTWMGGSKTVGNNGGQPGVYGTLGTPATGNIPGGRGSAAKWTDGSGNFWLFGGSGYDANGNLSTLNDLWKFNPSTNEWTWMAGSSIAGQPGVYGTLGTPAAANIPGSRYGASTWTDNSGNFWLFGGMGLGAGGGQGWLNDLWKFNPSTNQWSWMGGSSTTFQPGHYGTLGTPAAANVPGSRKFATSWTDSSGNFWLFGGYGDDGSGVQGWLDDLWQFNPATSQWAWIGGSSTVGSNGGQPGVYGTLGTPASANIPGGRQLAASWTDTSGNLWLFGGEGLDGGGNYGRLNDLWEFNPATNKWAWIGGSSTVGSNGGQLGVYGTLGIPASGNIPGGRGYAASWIDGSGNFWLFEGNGFGANANLGDLNDLWEYQPPGSTSSQVATPSFSPPAGTYTSPQTVTISDITPGATIYYTTDGTAPSTSSAMYSGPITVSSSQTIEAIATASGYTDSAVAIAAYTINATPAAATPTFTPPGGTYNSTQTVTISDATPGARIYYTTNGTTPTTGSTLYAGPLTISSSQTIEAIATASGYLNSAVATATYTINPGQAQGFILYSTVGNLGGSHSLYPNSLVTVDSASGTQQLVGQPANAANVAWLAANPANNLLYGTGLLGTYSDGTLYAIDPSSATVSSQVTLSQSVSTIAFSPQGTLYGRSGNSLGTINTATGQFSPVGTLSLPSGYFLEAMAFSPAGTLYGVEENGQTGAAFGQHLITLNPANGATVSDIGSLVSYSVEDMTYAPDGNIYATNFSYALLKINPQTASNTLIGIGNIGDLEGIAAAAAPLTATPAFSVAPGTYASPQTVTLTDATPGATIYYTTNGTTPSTASTAYSGPITVSSSETIEAIAAASGYANSAVAVAQYTINLPAPDFQLSVSPSSLSIAKGQSGTAVFTVTPANGFNSAVSFSCSGLPAEATCTFSPSTVTPNGSPVTSTLTVKTTAATTALRTPQRSSQRLVYAALFPFFAALFGFVLFRGRRRLGAPFWGMFLLLLFSAGLTSCGGGGGTGSGGGGDSGTPLGTSTVSVSASAAGSGGANHAATLTITITQ